VFPEAVGIILEREYRRAVAEGVPVAFESYDASMDRWFGLSAYPLGDGGLTVYSWEVTEKKRAEAEIARKNEGLQQLLETIRKLDQVKSDFFANVSHELRTPLALILGPAESILATGDNLTELQRRDLAVIHRNAVTLLKHVNDLLDVAKLDAGKYTAKYARIDLAREVRTVAAHFDALAPQRSLAYVIATPDILEAEVDPEKFDRILLNLLSNAFKFTPAGGRIRCALELSGDDRLLLSVLDSGPGVRPEMCDAIFERFHQAQGSSSPADRRCSGASRHGRSPSSGGEQSLKTRPSASD
jgi:signal transduction histidine kinase